ncbi:acyl-CoA dehydrogenase [Amycolatopsis antarctica]|uniref:Acyl-CoA dehydrogenase n=2 Tax=Amycolatopsis antarctica TaxID=1854586 RepID=A0A263D1A0_9PSEU|nr:acyl-CoA dehydrogenase [Amycolatopsis antarctica]
MAELAHPGQWTARRRWGLLSSLSFRDVPLARLVEAHLDALAIRTEILGAGAGQHGYWGVWAAEPPDGRVTARPDGDGGYTLSGTKRWCSGSHLCTHALVTVHAPDGRVLVEVDLAQDAVTPSEGEWTGLGMRGADTGSVAFDAAGATVVGGPGSYLDRAGFWHAAIGVAACWYGGAAGLAAPLRRAGAAGRLDEHALAHLGAVDAALHAARCALREAAATIDRRALERSERSERSHSPQDSGEPVPDARRRALRVRAVVEAAVTTVADHVGRALGPAPLAHDADHAQRLADLTVYVRQSHAERDLAALGRIGAPEDGGAL